MIRFTNFQMVKLSQLAAKDSDAQKPFSSQCCSESKCQVSTKSLTNQFWSATLISERTCTTTSSWAVEQQCSQAFQRDWARKWLLWPHQQWRSRCLLLKRENSWSGSVDQSCHHCLPSKPCGSPRLSIKKAVLKSSTENASDLIEFICLLMENMLSIFIIIVYLEFLKLCWEL